MIGFSEQDNDDKILANQKDNNQEKNMLSNKQYIVLDALTNLSNTVIEELNKANDELHDSKDKIQDQANRDYLTNLYNRRYFNEISQHHINLLSREEKPICVMMIDIDKFKNVNDNYGHSIGDDCIKLLATILENNIRNSDIIARFGGDEFAIILPNTQLQNAIELAEKLRLIVMNQKIDVKNDVVKFTISIGVDKVNYLKDNSIEESLNRADKALYKAKHRGRNQVQTV
jgi:diguanylate cyclase (GGDEF)-like protein